MTPENTFINSVHRHLPAPVNNRRRNPYWMKNNNLYTAGVWDVWYSGNEADLWVEYKFVKLPARESTLVVPDLSALQIDWGRERRAEGRNLAVIVGCKEGGVVFEHGEWEYSFPAGIFRDRLRSRQALAAWIMRRTNQ